MSKNDQKCLKTTKNVLKRLKCFLLTLPGGEECVGTSGAFEEGAEILCSGGLSGDRLWWFGTAESDWVTC